MKKQIDDENVLELPLGESEAAALLHVRPKTLRNWRGQGKGPKFLKSEGKISYLPSYIREYRSANVRRSTSDKGGDSG
jgi:hypothetical protein